MRARIYTFCSILLLYLDLRHLLWIMKVCQDENILLVPPFCSTNATVTSQCFWISAVHVPASHKCWQIFSPRFHSATSIYSFFFQIFHQVYSCEIVIEEHFVILSFEALYKRGYHFCTKIFCCFVIFFPVYTSNLRQYPDLSANIQTLYPLFTGFIGRYCFMELRPLNFIMDSSTATSQLGWKYFQKFSCITLRNGRIL